MNFPKRSAAIVAALFLLAATAQAQVFTASRVDRTRILRTPRQAPVSGR